MKRLLLLAAIAISARAANISITLDNPNQSGLPGQTLSFFGVITNTNPNQGDDPIFLNSDSLNFSLNDATVTDNFFANVPFFLAPGESSGDIDLFEITLADPAINPFGVYPGTYGLLGGMDGGTGNASDNLAQVDFSVNSVPEPGTFMLLEGGVSLAGISLMRRRRANGRSSD